MSMSTVHVALPFLLRLHAEYPPALIEMYKADRAFLVGSSLSTEGFRKQTTRATDPGGPTLPEQSAVAALIGASAAAYEAAFAAAPPPPPKPSWSARRRRRRLRRRRRRLPVTLEGQ